jgi:hypothetical protein
MKSLLASGALSIVVALSLSSCLYPPPPPPFAQAPFVAPAPGPYVAPVPFPVPPPVLYRHCAPGWHWVRGHHSRYGRWVRGHCAPTRYR